MAFYTRIKYSILLITSLILWNVASLANADKFSKAPIYKKDIELFKQAIRNNTDDAKAYNNLGAAYGSSGMHKESIDAVKQAIKIKPDYIQAYNNLGVTYGNSGMHKDAVNAFKQAIKINPHYVWAHFHLGYAYIILEDKGSALEQYSILKSLGSVLADELLKFSIIKNMYI